MITALSAVTTEAPQWLHRQRGRIPEALISGAFARGPKVQETGEQVDALSLEGE